MNERIVIGPQIQHGKPVIQGTRVPVARIIGGFAGGMTRSQVKMYYTIPMPPNNLPEETVGVIPLAHHG